MKLIKVLLSLFFFYTLISCSNSASNTQESEASDSLSSLETPVEEGVVIEAGGGPEKVNLPNEDHTIIHYIV